MLQCAGRRSAPHRPAAVPDGRHPGRTPSNPLGAQTPAMMSRRETRNCDPSTPEPDRTLRGAPEKLTGRGPHKPHGRHFGVTKFSASLPPEAAHYAELSDPLLRMVCGRSRIAWLRRHLKQGFGYPPPRLVRRRAAPASSDGRPCFPSVWLWPCFGRPRRPAHFYPDSPAAVVLARAPGDPRKRNRPWVRGTARPGTLGNYPSARGQNACVRATYASGPWKLLFPPVNSFLLSTYPMRAVATALGLILYFSPAVTV